MIKTVIMVVVVTDISQLSLHCASFGADALPGDRSNGY